MKEQIETIKQALLDCLAGEQNNKDIREALEVLTKIEQRFSRLPDESSVIYQK